MPSEAVDLLLPIDALQASWASGGGHAATDEATVEDGYEELIRAVGTRRALAGATGASGGEVGWPMSASQTHTSTLTTAKPQTSHMRMRHFRGLQIIGGDGAARLEDVAKEKGRHVLPRYTTRRIVCHCRDVARQPVEVVAFPGGVAGGDGGGPYLPPLQHQPQIAARAAVVEAAPAYAHDDDLFFHSTPTESGGSRLATARAARGGGRRGWDTHHHLAGLLKPPRTASPTAPLRLAPFLRERGRGGAPSADAARTAQRLVKPKQAKRKGRTAAPDGAPMVHIGW